MHINNRPSVSTPDLSLTARNDEVKSRYGTDTPSAEQSADNPGWRSSIELIRSSEQARARTLRKAMSARSLQGAHVPPGVNSVAASLNELAKHVSTIDLKGWGKSHRIRSQLLREHVHNARTDKTRERILFAKYKAENDMLPVNEQQTDTEIFARAAEGAIVLVNDDTQGNRYVLLMQDYRRRGWRKTPASVAAHLANAVTPLASRLHGLIPETIQHRMAVSQARARLKTQANQMRAQRTRLDAGNDSRVSFASPLDNPDTYENTYSARFNAERTLPEVARPTPETLLEQIDGLVKENGAAKALALMSEAQLEAFIDFANGKNQA